MASTIDVHRHDTAIPLDWATVDAAAIRSAIVSPGNVAHVESVMLALTRDPAFTDLVLDRIRNGILDLRLAMSWLAATLEPDLYLEIGVRRGFSLAMVAARRPSATIFGFDRWVRNYVGVGNPGPAFVAGELARIGYRGAVTFVSGNSHETLPRFFGERGHRLVDRALGRAARAPSREFDLVLVDGDHSIEGAYQDLTTVMRRVRIGGVIVFDDIAPDLAQFNPVELDAIRVELGPDPRGLGGLMGVWQAVKAEFPDFRYFEFTDDSPGLAFGIRVR